MVFAFWMKKLFSILFLILGIVCTGLSQQTQTSGVHAKIIDGDTIPQVRLREVEIISLKIPKSKKGKRKLSKLVKNVKKAYPYARIAGIQLRKYEYMLTNAESDKERRKLMKQAEREIKDKYGNELRELTFSQGIILIKLLDRETGETSYKLVQELRGNFTAFWYQAFARLWKFNLKTIYDPEGEDKQIETIIKMIDRGQI